MLWVLIKSTSTKVLLMSTTRFCGEVIKISTLELKKVSRAMAVFVKWILTFLQSDQGLHFLLLESLLFPNHWLQ